MSETKLIDDENTNSPDFENEVDPIQFLELLDEFLFMLWDNPSNEAIESIHKELDKYEIIIVGIGAWNLWVTNPFVRTNVTKGYPLLYRVVNYVQTRWWIRKFQHYESISIGHPNKIFIPLEIEVSTEMQDNISNDDISGLIVTLNDIHQTIIDTIKHGSGSVGIFTAPYAATNMNKLRQWLRDIESEEYFWEKRYPLTTKSFSDIVKETTFTVERTKPEQIFEPVRVSYD